MEVHPILRQLVADINALHLGSTFVEGVKNYKACWDAAKPIKSRDEAFKIVLYLPVAPSYEPRKMHYPWLTVTLLTTKYVRVKFHSTMRLATFELILQLLRKAEAAWKETS